MHFTKYLTTTIFAKNIKFQQTLRRDFLDSVHHFNNHSLHRIHAAFQLVLISKLSFTAIVALNDVDLG